MMMMMTMKVIRVEMELFRLTSSHMAKKMRLLSNNYKTNNWMVSKTKITLASTDPNNSNSTKNPPPIRPTCTHPLNPSTLTSKAPPPSPPPPPNPLNHTNI